MLYVLSPAHARGILGATIPATGLSNLQALGTEVVLTFFLVITMLSTLDATKYDPYARYDASAAVGLATATCYLIGVSTPLSWRSVGFPAIKALVSDQLGKFKKLGKLELVANESGFISGSANGVSKSWS